MLADNLLYLLENGGDNRKLHTRILLVMTSMKRKTYSVREIQDMLREHIHKEYGIEEIRDACRWLEAVKALIEHSTLVENNAFSLRELGVQTVKLIECRARESPDPYRKFIRPSYSPNVSSNI